MIPSLAPADLQVRRTLALRGTLDSVLTPLVWEQDEGARKGLAELAGTPIRLRFTLERARLFSFWASDSLLLLPPRARAPHARPRASRKGDSAVEFLFCPCCARWTIKFFSAGL